MEGKPVLNEAARETRNAIHEGLAGFYFDDIPRSASEEETAREAANELVRNRDIKNLNDENVRNEIRRLYKRAYLIASLRKIDQMIEEGMANKDAYKIASGELLNGVEFINLHDERHAITAVSKLLLKRIRDLNNEYWQLNEALKSERELTYEETLLLLNLISKTKGFIFKKQRGETDLQKALVTSLKGKQIWKKSGGDGTAGSAEAFSTISPNAYSRHGRPHRDDYGASGGRDDK